MSRSLITACILLILALTAFASEQEKSTNLVVYHQKDGEYIKRGTIVGLPGVPEYVAADNEIVEFKRDEFYQIKVKDERTGKILMSTVKMCQMVGSEWSDEFTLHLDENNEFYYLDYYPGSNYCQQDIKYPIVTKAFTTYVNVAKALPAPKPLVGNFASQKKTPQNTKKATAKVNDEVPDVNAVEEKTFFQKYWYLLIGGAFLLLTAAGAPEEGQQGQATRR